MSIPDYILKYAPWSISKAQCAEKCTMQFDYKYGAQKQKEVVSFEASRIGTAVHKALELSLQGTPQKQAFEIAADDAALTENERVQLFARWDQVKNFVIYIADFKKQHGVREEIVERRWAIRADGTPCKFFDKDAFFRGVLDYGLRTARGDLIIIDHKSGKEKELVQYDPQFRSYGLLALATYPELKGIQTAINFVMTDKLRWNKYIRAETVKQGILRNGETVIQDQNYLEWLISYLSKTCSKLTAPPAVVTNSREKWKCEWCGYRPLCKGPFGEAERGDNGNQHS